MTEKKPDIRSRWYGRRRGKKLRPTRQALTDTLLPQLRLTPDPDGAFLDLKAAFPGPVTAVWLEVGFGAGEHLAEQARRNPDIGFIGCEPFINGIAALLSRVDEDGLGNVRLYDEDARLLLPALPDAAIDKAFVLFSDPWPKKKHHRRRFISRATLDELSRVMADNAELRLASDHMGYVSGILEILAAHEDFSWTARTKKDWTTPPPDWVQTRYEQKALEQGIKPVYLRFTRCPRRA
ncbi:MAG: tRNA (guanine(46)-N(7))-methyltransferase TrmB [Rhodospirillales bacterium]